MQAINRQDRGAIHFTYAQVYTALTKAIENLSLFSQRPFLLTLLLGKAFVSRTMDLSHVQHCTVKLYEYFQLVEASLSNLHKTEGRLELVLSSPRVKALFSLNSTTVANQVRSSNLLIQLSLYCNTCIQYITLFCSYRFHVLTWMTTQRTSARNWSHTSLYYRCWRWLLRPDSCCEHYRCAVLWHLTVWFLCMYGVVLLISSAPEGTLSGPFTIPTVLVQETLLALLPCQPMDKVTRF